MKTGPSQPRRGGAVACRTRAGATGHRRGRLLPRLARHREVVAPIAGPAVLRRLLAERYFLSVGHGLEAVRGHAERHEVVVGGLGAPLAEREVVLDRPALVAVPLDGHAQEVELLEGVRVLG